MVALMVPSILFSLYYSLCTIHSTILLTVTALSIAPNIIPPSSFKHIPFHLLPSSTISRSNGRPVRCLSSTRMTMSSLLPRRKVCIPPILSIHHTSYQCTLRPINAFVHTSSNTPFDTPSNPPLYTPPCIPIKTS